jgi:hypothetical protein
METSHYTHQLLYAMNYSGFAQFIETLTGVPKLLGDPQYEGGGLHQIVTGGKLTIHADFNQNSYYNFDRRLDGSFIQTGIGNTRVRPLFRDLGQIYDEGGKEDLASFRSSGDIYHDKRNLPRACKSARLSARHDTKIDGSVLYYTISSTAHHAEWTRHTTLFQGRLGEQFKHWAQHLARDLTPPAIWRLISRAR